MPARFTPWGLGAGMAAGDAAPATATVRARARQAMERGGRIMVPESPRVAAVHAPRRASLHDGRGVESRRALREYWRSPKTSGESAEQGGCNECGYHPQVVRGGAG